MTHYRRREVGKGEDRLGLSCGRVFSRLNPMRKLLLPIALFIAGILVLAAAAYWYVHRYGASGAAPVAGYRW